MTNPEAIEKEIDKDEYNMPSIGSKWAIYRIKVNEAVELFEEFYTPSINMIRHDIAQAFEEEMIQAEEAVKEAEENQNN